jgi:light-harvesting complex I chlorophyll a/b binding protein 1
LLDIKSLPYSGLSRTADAAKFRRWRAIELKHGRVAQAAVIGYLVQESSRLPGYISPGDGLKFSDVPNGVAAIGAVPFLGWVQIFLFVGFLENSIFKQDEDKDPGDFGYGISFLKGIDFESKLPELKTKEIQNGRLGMLAIMELLTHDVAKPAGEGLLTLHHF